MSDFLDNAFETEQMWREAAISKARANSPSPVSTGFCLFCGEPVEDGKRWCNAECRDDWEYTQRN